MVVVETPIIDAQNFASMRIAEKLGMHYEKEVVFTGYSHPDHVYVIERPGNENH